MTSPTTVIHDQISASAVRCGATDWDLGSATCRPEFITCLACIERIRPLRTRVVS